MALTASKMLLEKYTPEAYREDILATAGVQYFKGGLVAIDSTTGLLVKLTNAMTVRGVYVCEDEIVGVTGQYIGVRTGIFKILNGDAMAEVDRGKLVFAGAAGDDSGFEAGTVATDAVIGTLEAVDGASAPGGAGLWVKIRGTHEYLQSAVAVSGA